MNATSSNTLQVFQFSPILKLSRLDGAHPEGATKDLTQKLIFTFNIRGSFRHWFPLVSIHIQRHVAQIRMRKWCSESENKGYVRLRERIWRRKEVIITSCLVKFLHLPSCPQLAVACYIFVIRLSTWTKSQVKENVIFFKQMLKITTTKVTNTRQKHFCGRVVYSFGGQSL